MAKYRGIKYVKEIFSSGNFMELLRFKPRVWERIGRKVIKMIRDDAKEGKLQGINRVKHRYVSKEYMKRKASGKAKPKGRRQKSRKIDFVDMTLTGDLLKSLMVKNFSETYVDVYFSDPLATVKLGQGRRFGRSLTTPQPHIRRAVKGIMLRQYDKRIRQFLNQSITIDIK